MAFFLVPFLICSILIPGFLSGLLSLLLLCVVSRVCLRFAIMYRHNRIAREGIGGGGSVQDLAALAGDVAGILTFFCPPAIVVIVPVSALIAFL